MRGGSGLDTKFESAGQSVHVLGATSNGKLLTQDLCAVIGESFAQLDEGDRVDGPRNGSRDSAQGIVAVEIYFGRVSLVAFENCSFLQDGNAHFLGVDDGGPTSIVDDVLKGTSVLGSVGHIGTDGRKQPQGMKDGTKV